MGSPLVMFRTRVSATRVVPLIETVPVFRRTATRVWLSEKGVNSEVREGSTSQYWTSWEDAYLYLVREAEGRVCTTLYRYEDAKVVLGHVRKLKAEEPEGGSGNDLV